MKQFAALLRKDNQPVRYLVVDDSVFARMDITMPQMEGIEAVERIVRQHAGARIVMVSSVGYQENILAALQKGAKHFVQKPVKPEVLYEILRYVLSDDPNAVGSPVAMAGEQRS
jgi:DNA-binding NarL/FixJ family response regulator